MMIAAFILTLSILLIITFDCAGPEEKDPFAPWDASTAQEHVDQVDAKRNE